MDHGEPEIPSVTEMLWPALVATRANGDSGTIQEINEKVVDSIGLDERQQAVPQGDRPMTKIEYRLHWARTYLKGMGLLVNSSRGVWATTERGRTVTQDEIPSLHKTYLQHQRDASRAKRLSHGEAAGSEDEGVGETESDWKPRLLAALLEVQPDAFERLARRLLREAGFVNASVTGRSSDGGIDGIGVYRLSLVSFPVFFQCKRYKGSVGAGAVRDFRGAMTGRGDKGLLITTGTFTAEAQEEATRDGAPPIDLIDGDRLCDLLKEFDMGVKTAVRQVEDVELEPSFFADL